MQHQRVGLDHLHRSPALVQTIAVVQLDSPQIGEQWDRRSPSSDLEALRLARIFQCLALRADPQSDSALFGRLGKMAVDSNRIAGSTSHTGDQQRGVDRLFQEAGRDLDLLEIQLR